MTTVLDTLNTQVIQAMDKAGITLERLMLQLQDELEANDTKIGYDKGVVISTTELAAHDIRQKARIDAHKLRGDYPAPGLDIKSTGTHEVRILRFGDEPDKPE